MSQFEESMSSLKDIMEDFGEVMRLDRDSVIEIEKIFLNTHRQMYEGFINLIDHRMEKIQAMAESTKEKGAKKISVK